jgi:hypothetical protein
LDLGFRPKYPSSRKCPNPRQDLMG